MVLSDGSWRRHFHADPQVVGRTVMLNGTAFTIVGVAPAQFIGTGNPPQAPDFWAPLMMQGQLSPGAAWLDRPETHRLQLLARVQADASIEQARAELQGLALQIAEFPETHKVDDRTIALTLQPAVYFGGTDDFRFAAVVALLMATVSIILIVACANLANMLLARGAARHKEIGMRLALGASRGRIVRQLLTESLLLAGMGGVTGLLLSFWGSTVVWRLIDRLIRILFLSDRPFAASVAPDGRILVFTVAVSIATGLLFGLSPALRISRPDLNGALKEETAGFGNRRRATRSWLNALQMAVSMTFLICAGLLLKGLAHAQSADLGFESSKVLMAFMNLGTDPVAAPALQKRIVDRLRKAPEIEDVALTDRFPFAGTWSPPIMVDDPAEMPSRRATRTLANYVSASYFHTLGISIQRGRTFTSADEEGGSAVAIVSEAAARRLWPSGDPIGKRLTLDMDFRGHLATFEVIGVVKDVRSANVSRIDPAFVYLPTSPGASYNILIRSNHDPARVFAAVTRAVESTDRRVLPTVRVMSVNEGPFVRMQTAIPAIVAPFVATLGCVALILAGTGIYGVTSYLAVQRTHEVGIRMALGATARDVQRLMVRQAMTPILAGGVVGLGAAATISRLLQSTLAEPSSPDFLFGVGAFDMTAFAGLSAFAMIVAAVASYIPARRATAVDPLVALRHE